MKKEKEKEETKTTITITENKEIVILKHGELNMIVVKEKKPFVMGKLASIDL